MYILGEKVLTAIDYVVLTGTIIGRSMENVTRREEVVFPGFLIAFIGKMIRNTCVAISTETVKILIFLIERRKSIILSQVVPNFASQSVDENE